MVTLADLPKQVRTFDVETIIRLGLLLNNGVALGFSAGTGRALFIVMSVIFCISILFNLLVSLRRIRARRSRPNIGNHEKQCPSLIILAIDSLGVLAFLSLYVCSTIDTVTRSRWGWAPIVLMAYASIGALVAL